MTNTFHLFNSMDSKVSFLNKLITVKEWISYLQKKNVNIIIDTVYYSWEGWGSKVIYSSEKKTHAYRQGMQFRIIPTQAWQKISIQKDSLAELTCMEKETYAKAYGDYTKAYEAYRKQFDQSSHDSIPDKLKKYYAPEIIGQLGWLNCDHFYKSRQNTDIDLDIPITFNHSNIEYYVIFRSFNGLVKYREDLNDRSTIRLKNLPIGQQVTLVAFAKSNGIMYQGKEDFTIEKNKKIPIGFNTISREQMDRIFRSNVKS